MEYALLFFAFICGLGVKLIGIPPLVGFLLAGFLLNFMGYTLSDGLVTVADLGITIMLFTIGLKLNLKDLSKREVWGGSVSHTLLWVALTTGVFYGLSVVASHFISALDIQSALLIAFALSFSSTVCVVKVLDESGEMKTRHGKLAIGILVMQDVFAVVFLVAATGKLPSLYAFGLLALFPLLPLIYRMIDKSGHGELLPLTGFMLALGGYQLFEIVNIKGDLGALIFGIMIAQHPKAAELSKSLMSFKDLFLVGFFLSIGLTALPTIGMLGIAIGLCLLLPIKGLLFFGLFTSLRLRARTAYLSSLILANYSEFGLIVGALAVSLGMLTDQWLVVIALAVSFSFVITSILYRQSHAQYNELKSYIKQFEKKRRLPEDVYPTMNDADFLVIGMGRVGTGAFNALNCLEEINVWGMDADQVKVQQLQQSGMNIICGDGEDIDLWENLDIENIQLVLLALPSIHDAVNITLQLKVAGYQGKVAAIARYEDEVKHLRSNGIDKVFNFFTEAGLGFAEESMAYAQSQQLKP